MAPLGVIELFYGLPWSKPDRNSYAKFLKQIGFEFYIYAPKADDILRRNWQKPPSVLELESYRAMRDCFAAQGLRFGMGLSPQGLFNNLSLVQRTKLQDKVKIISDLGIDILGLFFDDMKSTPDMADRQLEIVHLVQAATHAELVFCPSYYCNDSLLELFFGDRPPGYLEALGEGLAKNIKVMWTGEQIISPEISAQHLREVGKILKRKPFICDNYFANDGPINCAFLRLLEPTGRAPEAMTQASAWAFNPLNQANLAKIVLLGFSKLLKSGLAPDKAFRAATSELCPGPIGDLILSYQTRFADVGLDAMTIEDKAFLRQQLAKGMGPFGNEIRLWLDGHYAIGFDAVIEQSSFEGT